MQRLVFVHGFGGFNSDWADLIQALPGEKYQTHFLALPGHAEQPSCRQLGIESPADLAKLWAQKLTARFGPDFYLIGYSMGARLASLVAAEAGCQGLVLLSGGLGLASEAERVARRESDEALARQLELSPADFWQAWYKQELFRPFTEQQNGRLLQAAVAQKTEHNPSRLAEALRRLGLGCHQSLLPVLSQALSQGKITSLLYIAGEQDKKYLQFAASVEQAMPQAQVIRIPGAGHVLHREAPEACAAAIRNCLGENNGTKSYS